MTITYVKWKDACAEEQGVGQNVVPGLVILEEVGFLLAENEEAVTLGMEMANEGEESGRWRLHIPWVNILEKKDITLDQFLAIKQPRKRK